MNILLFGVTNVGKTTIGRILAKELQYNFYDLDEVIQKKFSVTQEKFVKTGTLEQRDEIRGKIIGEILQTETTSVIAITPMSFSQYFKDFLNLDNVLAIELIDSAENLFDRLVFSDENDVIYKDDVYKNEHKEYYLDEFEADLEWYGFVYKDIKNKFNVNAMPPDKATSKLIKRFHLLIKP